MVDLAVLGFPASTAIYALAMNVTCGPILRKPTLVVGLFHRQKETHSGFE